MIDRDVFDRLVQLEAQVEFLQNTIESLVLDERNIVESLEQEVLSTRRLALYALYAVRELESLGYVEDGVLELARKKLIRDLILLSDKKEHPSFVSNLFGSDRKEGSVSELEDLEKEIEILQDKFRVRR